VHLTAGAIAGLVSCVFLQPMDRIKTLLQQQRNIHNGFLRTGSTVIQREGILALWYGTVPTIYRNVPGNALYFATLDAIRTFLASLSPPTPASSGSASGSMPTSASGSGSPTRSSVRKPGSEDWHNLVAGGLARGIVGTALLPVTVVKARFESDMYAYRSVWWALVSIGQKEGVRGLFSGLLPTIIRDVPYAGLYVWLYEYMRRGLAKWTTLPQMSLNFISGMAAGLVATCLTHPADTIKTRMQLDPIAYRNTLQTVQMIIQEGGILRLFRGITPRAMRKACSSAITWSLYEELVSLIQKIK